ncbi:MAG: response regulator [Deltaproteobacteria bacterium]|nr:response regulator [Deltaproteobacteria bacterium]
MVKNGPSMKQSTISKKGLTMRKLDEKIIDQELMDEIISEFRENIENAIHYILLLEEDPEDTESVHALFRHFHTIKGNSGVVGFEKINRLSHVTENLLDNIREKTLEINSQIIATLLMSADCLTALVDEIEGGAPSDEGKLNDFINSISSYLSPEAPPNTPLASEIKKLPSIKILIVDDEFVSRKTAQKILSQYGECDSAMNGIEALEAFKLAHEEGRPYDLITMDILMPDMDGIEALTRMREWEESKNIQLGKGVKLVMVTATNTSDSVLSSFNEGCEAYLVKPFNKEDLTKAMSELGLKCQTTYV